MYGKYFSSTFTGSMFGSGLGVFAVWGYVVANAVNGTVELNPVLLAPTLGTDIETVKQAINYLCQPDSQSRNPTEEGRRLVKEGAFQYRVVTHNHYRNMRSEDDRRAYNAAKMRESRARAKGDPDAPKAAFGNRGPKPKKTKIDKQSNITSGKVIDSDSPLPTVIHSQLSVPIQKQKQKQKQDTNTNTLSASEQAESPPARPPDEIGIVKLPTPAASITVNHSESLSITQINVSINEILEALAPIHGVMADAVRIVSDCRAATELLDLGEVLYLVRLYVAQAKADVKIEKPMGFVIRMVPRGLGGKGYQLSKPAPAKEEPEPASERPADSPVLADTMWRSITAILKTAVAPHSFETWIKPLRAYDVIQGKLYIRMPTPEFRLVGEKYANLISEAIRDQSLEIDDVRFVADLAEVCA